MLQPTVILLFITFAVLPCFNYANPLPTAVSITPTPTKCSYDVLENRYMRDLADAGFGPIQTMLAVSLDACQRKCDNDPMCANASFRLPPSQQNCMIYQYLGYPGHIALQHSPKETLLRLRPNSCDKPAATPTPFVCSERTISGENGCKYHIKCNVQVKPYITSGFLTLRDTARHCERKAATLNDTVGFQWFQGGKCQIATNSDGFMTLDTKPRPHGEVWQLVKDSCNSTSTSIRGRLGPGLHAESF